MLKKATCLQVLMMILIPAFAGAAEKTTEPIRICGNFVEPFVMEKAFSDNQEITGFTVELLQQISDTLNEPFYFDTVKDVNESLSLVKSGDFRIGGAAITVTNKREADGIDFSIPYFNSKVGILTLEQDKISNLPKMMEVCGKIFGYLMIYVFVTALFMWICEKGKDAFDDEIFPGLPQAIWWTVVTMSTVGYGDFVPKKWIGKAFAMLTIFVGIITFGWVITEMSAIKISAEQYQISSVNDLSGKKVAAKPGTASWESVSRFGVIKNKMNSVIEGLYLLRENKVDAVVYDWPALAYHSMNDADGKFHLVPQGFDEQYYAFAFKEGDPLKERFNRAILQLMENGAYEKLHQKYFNMK